MPSSIWISAPPAPCGSAVWRAYFNAGLLIFDRRSWCQAEILPAYAAALERHEQGCLYKADCTSIEQCALNDLYAGRWFSLPTTYNMQASAKFTPLWQHALIRHYCGPRNFIPPPSSAATAARPPV